MTKNIYLTTGLIFSFITIGNASIVFWDGSTTTPNSAPIPGVASAQFADPAGNQHFTTTPLALINGSSASSGYAGASGGNNFQASSKIGALSTASSTYFSVTLIPSTGYALTLNSISFGERSTSTGPQLLTVYSSIDNYAAPIGSVTAANNSAWLLKSIGLGGNSAATDTAITLRIYGSNGTGTQSALPNWRIDDIGLDITATTAIPEPSTWLAGALLALPFGAQGVRYLRNRKRA